MTGQRDTWREFGRISAFGLTMGLAMLLCGGLGLMLDRMLGTAPVFTSILFLAGGASACWYAIVKLLQ